MQDHVASLMTADHIESSLTEYSGRGWSASVVGVNWVGGSLCYVCVSSWVSVLIYTGSCITCVKVIPEDIEYRKRYEGDVTKLQSAVEEHMYPPAISLEVEYSEVPKRLQSPKRILLRVLCAKREVMNFPIDFFEEKEGVP